MASVTALPPSQHGYTPVPPRQAPIKSLPSTENHSTLSPSVPRGPVTATLNFYRAPKDGSVPFNYVEKPPEGEPQRNFSDMDGSVNLHDVRDKEDNFDIDKQAFAALKGYPHNSAIDWHDDDNIKREYYPEVERVLLEHVPGAKRILLFDHTIRRAEPNAHRAPVNRAHIDQTPFSAKQRVEFHLSDEAPELLKGRYRIINVWRPLNGAVESHPLAFADSATVPDDDMVSVQHRYPTRTGETAAVKHNPQHQWYYWSGVDNDERLLLQCFDSQSPSNRVPHSAFVDPRSTEESKARESIEVRALVFG